MNVGDAVVNIWKRGMRMKQIWWYSDEYTEGPRKRELWLVQCLILYVGKCILQSDWSWMEENVKSNRDTKPQHDIKRKEKDMLGN